METRITSFVVLINANQQMDNKDVITSADLQLGQLE